VLGRGGGASSDSDGDGSGDNNGENLMITAVKEKVLKLLDDGAYLFGDISQFGCQCPGEAAGVYAPGCCAQQVGQDMGVESLSTFLRSLEGSKKAELLSSFVSTPVRTFKFDEIENSGIGESLLVRAFLYIDTDIWTNRSITTSHDVKAGAYVLSEEQKEIASRDALYQTTKPLTGYGLRDAFQETTTASAFEVCMGAVSQVMFTLPVAHNTSGEPTTLSYVGPYTDRARGPLYCARGVGAETGCGRRRAVARVLEPSHQACCQ
jgi:hypothetical protein